MTSPEPSPLPANRVPGRRRLQRPADFTGPELDRFRQVFSRHGLPGLLLVPLLFAHEAPRDAALDLLGPALDAPLRYGLAGTAILAALLSLTILRERRLTASRVGWTLYLGALSAWEEAAFRVGLPALLVVLGTDETVAVLGANVLFGAMHWFTLRWRLLWCIGAALGGIALARALEQRGDLAFVVAAHWVATFLNTPRPPGDRGPGRRPL